MRLLGTKGRVTNCRVQTAHCVRSNGAVTDTNGHTHRDIHTYTMYMYTPHTQRTCTRHVHTLYPWYALHSMNVSLPQQRRGASTNGHRDAICYPVSELCTHTHTCTQKKHPPTSAKTRRAPKVAAFSHINPVLFMYSQTSPSLPAATHTHTHTHTQRRKSMLISATWDMTQ